jgi:hypothetical protein
MLSKDYDGSVVSHPKIVFLAGIVLDTISLSLSMVVYRF